MPTALGVFPRVRAVWQRGALILGVSVRLHLPELVFHSRHASVFFKLQQLSWGSAWIGTNR